VEEPFAACRDRSQLSFPDAPELSRRRIAEKRFGSIVSRSKSSKDFLRPSGNPSSLGSELLRYAASCFITLVILIVVSDSLPVNGNHAPELAAQPLVERRVARRGLFAGPEKAQPLGLSAPVLPPSLRTTSFHRRGQSRWTRVRRFRGWACIRLSGM
jgi:hypothetical protein